MNSQRLRYEDDEAELSLRSDGCQNATAKIKLSEYCQWCLGRITLTILGANSPEIATGNLSAKPIKAVFPKAAQK